MNPTKSLLLIVLLSSCVEVGFRSPQPSKGSSLGEIPSEIIAFYSDIKADSSSNLNDLYDMDELDEPLDENTILKKWKGKYFLNEREDSLWHVIMVVPAGNGRFETYRIDGGNENTVKKLKEITDVIEIKDEDGDLDKLILDPSSREFKKIIKSGAFEIIDIF